MFLFINIISITCYLDDSSKKNKKLIELIAGRSNFQFSANFS